MTINENELKKAFFDEANIISEKLRQDKSTLAVILSGPEELGRTEGDKLYIAAITDKDDGVIEHHFLDRGWDEVKRPIEMGKFPLAVIKFVLEKGYFDMVSYKLLEALRCGRILWEKENIGTKAIEASKRYIPTKSFIGENLHGAISDTDDAISLLKAGDYANAVIVTREAATKAVGMIIKGKSGLNEKAFLEAVKDALPPEKYELYLEIMGLDNIGSALASENAMLAGEFVEHTLKEIGVNPRHILGNSEKVK